MIAKVKALHVLAEKRGQTLAQMAVVWVLKHPAMTSVILGASKVKQIEDAVAALDNSAFTAEELNEIESILKA